MHRISCLCHIEAGGFHTACGIRAGNIKLIDAILTDVLLEVSAGKRVGLRLNKDIARHHLQLRGKLRTLCVRFECPRTGRQIVVLDIDDRHSQIHCPVNGGVDCVDDIPVVLRNVVLNVNYDKCFITHYSRASSISPHISSV